MIIIYNFHNIIHTVSGQYVSLERGQTHSLQGVPGLGSQESREVTFQKGRKLIEEVAICLNLLVLCFKLVLKFLLFIETIFWPVFPYL